MSPTGPDPDREEVLALMLLALKTDDMEGVAAGLAILAAYYPKDADTIVAALELARDLR